IACLVEDPNTKRQLPRNYVEGLEERVAFLESILQQSQVEPSDPNITHQGAIQPSPPLVAEQYGAEDEPVSDLASKVGMLGLKAAGAEPHYLGSSSVFAFSRIINSSLRQITSTKPGFANAGQDVTSPPSPCLLPDYATAMKLSNAYFRSIHPQYPFLHEPTFRKWEADLLRPTGDALTLSFDFVPIFFVNIVYAVGALLLPNSEELAQQLYISAQLYIDHIMALDNLESIQAVLCCTMYSLRSSTGPSIWYLSGFALRMCTEFGYHRSSQRLGLTNDLLRLELRRRSFWCVYVVDCAIATMLGRPLGISLVEVDAELPLDINDSEITSSGLCGPVRSSSTDSPTTTTIAIHVIRLRCLWARIHTSLYSDTTACNPSHPTYATRIEGLRSELEQWLASRPPIAPNVSESLSIFGSSDWYQLNYSYSIIMIYRGQITNGKGAPDKIGAECLKAAENICHGYRHLYVGSRGKPVNYTWGSLHFLFTAGLTYLHCLWNFPKIRDGVRHEDLISTCTDCTRVLIVMSQRWETVAPYHDIFEALSSRTMTMMLEKSQAQRTDLRPMLVSNGLDSDDLTQWMTGINDVGMSNVVDEMLNGLIGDYNSPGHDEQQFWDEMITGSCA
ncbi:fungal-specific transcription factor domain-containing protein, partial [Cadophora sp. MPI-SDFR-AT-0126]